MTRRKRVRRKVSRKRIKRKYRRLPRRLAALARRARHAGTYTRVRVQEIIARANRRGQISNAFAEKLLATMRRR